MSLFTSADERTALPLRDARRLAERLSAEDVCGAYRWRTFAAIADEDDPTHGYVAVYDERGTLIRVL